MKNFSLKNIALVLAVLFGTTATYSMDVMDEALGGAPRKVGGKAGVMKPAQRYTPDCEEATHFAPHLVPQICPAPTAQKWAKWTVEVGCHGAIFIQDDFSVALSKCGEKMTYSGNTCIERLHKPATQATIFLKMMYALDKKFNHHVIGGMIESLEKCDCSEKRDHGRRDECGRR